MDMRVPLQMGAQARLMSSALRVLAPLALKHQCTIIFINQIRMKVPAPSVPHLSRLKVS